MTASTSTSAAGSSAAVVLAAYYHRTGLDSDQAYAELAAEYAAADIEIDHAE